MEQPYYKEIAEGEYRKAYRAGRDLLRFSKEPCPWLVEFIDSKYFVPDCDVIDFGCGEGINAVYLAKQGCRVTGIDIAEPAIRKAEELAQEVRERTRFLVGDMVCCPELADESFDLAVACACFGRLIEDDLRTGFLQETQRVLRQGGYLFFNNGILFKEIELSFPDIYAKLKSRSEFAEWIEEERRGQYTPPSQRYETREGYESMLRGVGYRIIHSHLDVSEQAWGIVIWARKAR
jgi:ubiquinone/menaquinone biosynthesis C-methylase UbiE